MSAPRILVVEDNPLTRKMLRLALQAEGYAVLEAEDGRTALARAAAEPPDLVLQDLVLPDMDGLDLARRLRQLPGGAALPLVALSGFGGRLDEAEGTTVRFAARLVKPVEPSQLIETLAVHLPLPPTPGSAGQGRRLLLVDEDPLQARQLRHHFAQQGFDVTVVPTSAAALAAARERPPDVVVCHMIVAAGDGFRLFGALRLHSALTRIPILLLASGPHDGADRSLALALGANDIVLPEPDLASLDAAVARALAEGAVPAPRPDVLAAARARAAELSLAHLVEANQALGRRCALQRAQLGLLGGIAEALTRQHDPEGAVRDVLAATLDVAGVSMGAVFLRDPAGTLTPRYALGFDEAVRRGLPGFFGHLGLIAEIAERRGALSIPSPEVPAATAEAILAGAGATHVEVVALVAEGEGIGALLLASRGTDRTSQDAVVFARAIGGQLAQSLALARRFAEVSRSELRYRTLMHNAHDAIVLVTHGGLVREVNQRFLDLLGYARDEVVGHHVGEFAAPGHEEEGVTAFYRLVAAGGGTSPTVGVRCKDGGQRAMRFSVAMLDLPGDPLALAIGRDVTEELATQERLMVADRMASLGTLAAAVAHEMNNPLAAVLANLDLAVRELDQLAAAGALPAGAELPGEVRDAQAAAARLRDIVRDLRIFSREEEEERGPVDVRAVLDSTVRLAWNEIRHRARLVRDYTEVPPVIASEPRLGQVFLNLLVNAAQAIPEGAADQNQIALETRSDGDRVTVAVRDTGSGMSETVRRRLFTAFFTTKPAGVGTGLGLSISHRLITAMGGTIDVESAPGRGSTFRVTLPAAPRPAVPAAPPTAEPPRPAPRRSRILVVDDEEMVGVAVRRLLSRDHDVQVLTRSEEALARFEAGETFDLILCDLMMPVMTGMELHAALGRVAPAQAERMVFLTGGAFTPQARQFLEGVPNPCLDKPFEAAALRALVNDRLR